MTKSNEPEDCGASNQEKLFDENGLPRMIGFDGLAAQMMLKLDRAGGILTWTVNGVGVSQTLGVSAIQGLYEAIRPYVEGARLPIEVNLTLLREFIWRAEAEHDAISRMYKRKSYMEWRRRTRDEGDSDAV